MIITRTPLRISFTGGGTDLPDYYLKNGGAVVSAGIDKYIYIAVNKKFDNSIRVSYSRTELVDDVDDLRHELVRESMKLLGIRGGIEIASVADIPAGTGLGSSSSFTVGLLNALHVYSGYSPSSEELAQQACYVEIGVLGHPIGKQDQYAAAYGGMNYFGFEKDDTVTRKRILLNEDALRRLGKRLMLFYTGVIRRADTVLMEQKNNTSSKMSTLDYMKCQAVDMYHDLAENGISKRFGEALHEGWIRKRSLASTISNSFFDECYDRALAAGAVGGKLVGAGGGGFLLFYCEEDWQTAVEKAVGLPRIEFQVSKRGSCVICCE